MPFYDEDEDGDFRILPSSSSSHFIGTSTSSGRLSSERMPAAVEGEDVKMHDQIAILQTQVADFSSKLSELYDKMLKFEDFLFFAHRIHEKYKKELSLWNCTWQEAERMSKRSSVDAEVIEQISKCVTNHDKIRDDVQNLLRTFNEIAACASRDLQDFLNQHSRILPPFASVNMSSNPLMRLQEVQNDMVEGFQRLMGNTQELKSICEQVNSHNDRDYSDLSTGKRQSFHTVSHVLRQQTIHNSLYQNSKKKQQNDEYDSDDSRAMKSHFAPRNSSKPLSIDQKLSERNSRMEEDLMRDSYNKKPSESDSDFNPDDEIHSSSSSIKANSHHRKRKSPYFDSKNDGTDNSGDDDATWIDADGADTQKRTPVTRSRKSIKDKLPEDNRNDRRTPPPTKAMVATSLNECIDLT